MLRKKYNNFVKAVSPSVEIQPKNLNTVVPLIQLSGEEAQRIYIEEVKDVRIPIPNTDNNIIDLDYRKCSLKRKKEKVVITDKELFVAVQNNEVETVKQVLNDNPEKLNIVDEFGWSLLMIACQANLGIIVKELLDRGINTSVRDKAGNSAQNLVIKNKNLELADLLLGKKQEEKIVTQSRRKHKRNKLVKQEFSCDICKNTYPDRDQHMSSTLHNINASKSKKPPLCYKIPETNRGFQIMLKTGWNKESGLGFRGSGIQYPIKPVQKKDRRGLGHDKDKLSDKCQADQRQKDKKTSQSDYQSKKKMEISFRREFY